MIKLTNQESVNIYGGAISTLPNFKAYAKIITWICKTIRSWF